MKIPNIKKILLIIFLSNFVLNCGYQSILNKENQIYSIKEFSLEGNKRLGGLLKNNLITPQTDENNLIVNIKSEKKNQISNKSETGKILKYSVSVTFEITAVKDIDKNIVLSQVYSKKQDYIASDVYLNTINNEKKVVEGMIESIANEILIALSSIYQEK